MATIVVLDDDLWMMIHATVRYALGRMTYMPDAACDIYRRYKSCLSTFQRKQIYEEIRAELLRVEKQGKMLGAKFDHDLWKKLVTEIGMEEGFVL